MTGTSLADAQAAPAKDPAAILSAVICYAIWGVLPLFFMIAVRLGATPLELVAERCVWAVFWAAGLVWLSGQGGQALTVLRQPRTLAWLVASALIIGGNWTVFVWGVAHGKALETSLGYYINPLLTLAVGAVMFREKISRTAWIAVALAGAGVCVQTWALGHLPWVGLILAASFCAYGVIRKQVAADAQTGLFVEGLVLFVPGLTYCLWLQHAGAGHFGHSFGLTTMLLLTGPLTAAPLVLFAWAARRLTMSTLAFIQFLGPTLQFIVGLATGEVMTPLRAASFVLIWGGVAVFVWGAWQAGRAQRLGQSPA